MAVDGPPLAILPPVDVGDAQGRRLDRAAVHGEGDVLVADGVGQVPAGAGGHQLTNLRSGGWLPMPTDPIPPEEASTPADSS
jgi:hypothetical protein